MVVPSLLTTQRNQIKTKKRNVTMTSSCLWQPSNERIAKSNLTKFIATVNSQYDTQLADITELHEWSLHNPAGFWRTLLQDSNLLWEGNPEPTLVDADRMPGAQWFPSIKLNFAENLLPRRDDEIAMVFRGEDQVYRSLSWRELYTEVAKTAQALRDLGVVAGDRVAGFMPNMPEAVIAMLATTSVGAVWSSSSPDFGVKGVLDRFGQIEPTVLFTADGYFYNGKKHDSLTVVAEFAQSLPSLKRIVVVPYVSASPVLPAPLAGLSCGTDLYAQFTNNDATEINFLRSGFDHPVYIMYSSGTTGIPKCIVHGAGGSLLQHVKEHRLHADVKPGDRLFYFTTCGWMMWNWLVSGLASCATIMLFDGSPFYPSGNVLFDYAQDDRITLFGTSAKFIDAAAKAKLQPIATHDLSSVESLLSTGSPLVAESFDYVYTAIKKDVCLSSVSGGTDILSCFISGSPTLPVHRGELQCSGLGMAVEVFDDDGRAIVGKKGELVCSAPFPCMPIGFWNDPDGRKYHKAYFDRFDQVWCHGDYIERTERGSYVIYGRSDAVLNPGGVRIGTAEIYRQVEQLEEVIEGLVVGQDWQGDVRVVLFVRLRDDIGLDDRLIDKIKQQIRAHTTPRHVPAKVISVADIPRTKSGKIVELAVRNVIHGEQVKNRDALMNPEALELFSDLLELQS